MDIKESYVYSIALKESGSLGTPTDPQDLKSRCIPIKHRWEDYLEILNRQTDRHNTGTKILKQSSLCHKHESIALHLSKPRTVIHLTGWWTPDTCHALS